MTRIAAGSFHRLVLAGALLLLLLAVSGCAVRFLSSYDAETDREVSALQKDVTVHLARLAQLATSGVGAPGTPRSPECKFQNFADTYAQFAARARVLKVRNEAREKNELTTRQIESLAESLKTGLADFHAQAEGQCLTAAAIQAPQQILDQHFRSILKLELAKKSFRAGE